MWTVVLKDGTRFLGKRLTWREGWFEQVYRVAGSRVIPVGSIVVVANRNILYRFKEAKNGRTKS